MIRIVLRTTETNTGLLRNCPYPVVLKHWAETPRGCEAVPYAGAEIETGSTGFLKCTPWSLYQVITHSEMFYPDLNDIITLFFFRFVIYKSVLQISYSFLFKRAKINSNQVTVGIGGEQWIDCHVPLLAWNPLSLYPAKKATTMGKLCL